MLCFDQDGPGQEATKEACELLPVGKVKIMTLPKKDANEVLLDKASQRNEERPIPKPIRLKDTSFGLVTVANMKAESPPNGSTS